LIGSVSLNNLLQGEALVVYLRLTQHDSSIVCQNRFPFLKVFQNFMKFINIHIYLNAKPQINRKPANKNIKADWRYRWFDFR
jgi:hypothetical protein